MNAKDTFRRTYCYARFALNYPGGPKLARDMADQLGATAPELAAAAQAGLELAKKNTRIREEFPVVRERMHYLISNREIGEFLQPHPTTWVGDASFVHKMT